MRYEKDVKKTTTTTTEHEYRLNRSDIIEFLRKSGAAQPPQDARVYLTLPGGGEWRGDYEIEDGAGGDDEIVVEWTTTETEQEIP